jgi:hypothetical protein
MDKVQKKESKLYKTIVKDTPRRVDASPHPHAVCLYNSL